MSTGIRAPFLSRLAAELARTHTSAHKHLTHPDIRTRIFRLDVQIERIYETLSGTRARELCSVPGTEWLIDNEHIVNDALQQLRNDLPQQFFRKLPLVEYPEHGTVTRVEALIITTIEATEVPLDMSWLAQSISAYQTENVLRIGELWAVPALLRAVILERLCQCAETLYSAGDDTSREHLQHCDELAGCILTLGTIAHFRWPNFVEQLSRVDEVLARDPAEIYGTMDFATRDDYRKSVEAIAERCDYGEWQVAETAIYLALGENDDSPQRHVGHYLIGEGNPELLQRLGYRPTIGSRLATALRRKIASAYVLGILGGSAFLLLILYRWLLSVVPTSQAVLIALLALPPALMICSGLLNWIITRFKTPYLLPKLDFSEGIAAGWKTAVAVPAFLTNRDEIRELLATLEINYLGNTDALLHYVLLTDFPDAPSAAMPGEESLLDAACDGIRALNARHGPEGRGPFHLLHRRRLWNESEGHWMGWERKRGKLAEFNQFLLEGLEGTFVRIFGDSDQLKNVRLVICLDADTHLPAGSARQLAATLAHPLNRPQFDSQSGRVTTGYTIIQPRIEINPVSANVSLFSKIFTGDVTFDLYTHAVSNVYQDILSEGIFVGKGIYDLEGFTRSVEGELPENRVLSHDLLEGLHGRAALASDIVLFEDYPSALVAFVRRQHRWIRGDWQLCPWMGWRGARVGPHRARFRPKLIDRWKLADNLSRSLLLPCLLAMLVSGWILFPHLAWQWSLFIALIPGLPILFEALAALRPANWRWGTVGSTLAGHGQTIAIEFSRWVLMLVFLPYQTASAVDAIVRTILRLVFRRGKLLEWTSAAHVARQLGPNPGLSSTFVRMSFAVIFALATTILLWLAAPGAIFASVPFLIAWTLSPLIAWWISKPRHVVARKVTDAEAAALRLLARRTWHFFETFVNPENHWLPPDNVQQAPRLTVAQRTSPSNIGFALLSMLSAYDFGYLALIDLYTRVANTLETLKRLPKYRGHLLNWIRTNDLQPLEPRYISTVDSGNLAGCLIALAQGLEELPSTAIPSKHLQSGICDTIDVMRDQLERLKTASGGQELRPILTALDKLYAYVRSDHATWWKHLATAEVHYCEPIESEFLAALEEPAIRWSAEDIAELRGWIRCLRREIRAARREYDYFLPWREFLLDPPELYGQPGAIGRAYTELCDRLNPPLPLTDIAAAEQAVLPLLTRLDELLEADLPAGDRKTALAFNRKLLESLELAAGRARESMDRLNGLVVDMRRMVNRIDFRFLYDDQRSLFHIGYNASSGELDTSYYDLLASEARLASFIAIGLQQVPTRHWLHLGRPLTRIRGNRVLLSWSATLFEYLMPGLLMKCPERSLLNQSSRTAVDQHRRHTKNLRVPWGISESGYYRFDQHGNYQYRAFGVPRLGLSRHQDERLVISPYASVLALPFAREAVIENLDGLRKLGVEDQFGMREALDYGVRKRAVPSTRGQLVGSYMAHHQGMIILALGNALLGDPMVRRFHADPRIASIEPLLYEETPAAGRTLTTHRITATTDAEAPHPNIADLWSVAPGEKAVNVLSNGHLNTHISSQGGGAQHWNDIALTRWEPRADGPLGGLNLFFKDLDNGDAWSLGAACSDTGKLNIEFAPHMARFHFLQRELLTRVTIFVAPDADAEIRKLVITNESNTSRSLFVTSAAEPIMTRYEEYCRHPAFSRLFIDNEFIEENNALVFRRRPRRSDEQKLYMAHAIVTEDRAGADLYFDTDRRAFLGRRGDPQRPMSINGEALTLSGAGETPDPWMAMGVTIDIPPRNTVQIAFLTAVADTRHKVLDTIARFQSFDRISWSMNQARTHNEHDLARAGLMPGDAREAARILAEIYWPTTESATKLSALKSCREAQSSLWRHGISGDYPIVMMSLAENDRLGTAERLLRCYTYWNLRGIAIDLVFLDESRAGYSQPTRDRLRGLIERSYEHHVPFRGTIVIVNANDLQQHERNNLVAAAAYFEAGGKAGLPRPVDVRRVALPPFVPVPSAPIERLATESLEQPHGLLFENGYGGFSEDGREYVIYQPNEISPPAPWVNVLANPGFGCLTTSAGLDFTWSNNSSEYRLTRWHNDPVTEDASEALYFRDEETAAVWSPTPLPVNDGLPYRVSHGAGYTRFEHNSNGLMQRVVVFADPDEPVKIIHVRLMNLWSRGRRLTLTYAVEWVLGNSHADNMGLLVTESDPESHAILVRNGFTRNHPERVTFLGASAPPHGITTDLTEFLGPDRSWRNPAGLHAIGLSGALSAGPETGGAYQLHINLAGDDTTEMFFLLGTGENREEALERVRRFQDGAFVRERRTALDRKWDDILGRIQIETPDPALDLLTNRWLLYQVLSSRLWGRTGFYQPGGAFGFRDQLQDVLALLWTAPKVAREQIMRAAAVQFEDGDVLHWWHTDPLRGVRTRCSDDLLWLPFTVSEYVRGTGDDTLLDEQVHWLDGAALESDEDERYAEFSESPRAASIYEHCCRAIDIRLTVGAHGLPFIGTGDWNDGLNRVGVDGKGESAWMAWFMCDVCQRFAPICDRRGDPDRGRYYLKWAQRLVNATEDNAWDGNWYARGFYDDGDVLGGEASDECQIDLNAQTWAALSGAGRPDRIARAMQAVEQELVDPRNQLIKLLAPPFENSAKDPGYIKGYPPGSRENGGQYNHAAVWAVWAMAELGHADRAMEWCRWLNPVYRTADRAAAERYRIEPYVMPGDISAGSNTAGRGGWTWYSGSAAWYFRLIVEKLLGLNFSVDGFSLSPCVPDDWPQFNLRLRKRETFYDIVVEQPGRLRPGNIEIRTDDEFIATDFVEWLDDNRHHDLTIRPRTVSKSATRPTEKAL